MNSTRFIAKWVMCVLLTGVPALAQFTSGSTGADGALDYSKLGPAGTYVFDPNSFSPPLNPAHDNIFNFTTINVPNGYVVRFSQSVLNGPVVWLATGAVTILGVLDLSGSNGASPIPTANRSLTTPGAGGYPGGAGALGTNPPTAGLGPGGGAARTATSNGVGGKYTGNQYAIPLVGGSGGGGGTYSGGAGGGAILIASSVSISMGISSSGINANGGNNGSACDNGNGAGGAVRLVAPSVNLGPSFIQVGGQQTCGGVMAAGNGAIRIESLNNPGGQFNCFNGPCPVTYGAPYSTFATSSIPPTLKVTSVNGVPVAQPATGSFQIPDVTINSGGPVTLQIQASQVPPGTIVNLLFFSDNAPDFNVNTTGLVGTIASSSVTTTVTFPPGFTRGFVSASFTPQ